MSNDVPSIRLDRIAERMAVLGIESDRELARRAGVDNATVSVLRQGNRPNIAAPTLAKIARALRCSTSYLLGESELLNGPGITLPPSGAEMLELMVALPADRNAELMAVGRIMSEAERQRAEREAEIYLRLHEFRARWGDEAAAAVEDLVLAAVKRRDYDAAAALLRRDTSAHRGAERVNNGSNA